MTDFGLEEPPSVHRDELPPGSVILDVREDDEWGAGHIDGAVHVPLDRLANRMTYEPAELLSDEPLVVTCKGGGRARRATAWLNANGFDAVLLDGGMLGWEAAGHPMISDTGEPPVVR
ncbi:MAG: rhodanese-like domain-containing protein [Actinomycetota bacterium]|nr:rhodanese-like domain-containing protein [Actinomycetota bacterium]MDQ2955354.1 rhodanese-like domain-containing protein [Actinomycetota bacterium]